MDVIFLFYGLAFLALGFVIAVQHEPDSALRLSRVLWWLAAFGFLHGLLEWTELWRLVRGDTPLLAAARPFLLLASFVMLFEFGRRLVLLSLSVEELASPAARLLGPWTYAALFVALAAAVAAADDGLAALALWSRRLPGFLGAVLAAAGFDLYRRRRIAAAEDTTVADRVAWHVAAVAFLAYGVLSGLVVQVDWLPGLVQLLRAACAAAIAAAMVRIMRMFDVERRGRLRHAMDAGQYSLAQFQESKARYEALLSAVSDAVVGLDGDGKLSFANDAALAMLGYSRGELLGQPFHMLAHHTAADGKPQPIEECPIQRTLRDGELRSVDADLFWRKNKTWFPAAYRAVPMRRAGKAAGAVVLLRNLAD